MMTPIRRFAKRRVTRTMYSSNQKLINCPLVTSAAFITASQLSPKKSCRRVQTVSNIPAMGRKGAPSYR